ncbi:MAG: hypothetical protein H7061_04785, partial [Bdellovibrionaceae bacterium]|nr:hypothetical protein [Bdellovibrio sp.]
MKIKSIKKCLSWTAAQLACSVMVFSPVALGKEAEKITEANVQNAIKLTGLNKKITLGEFWKLAKNNFPLPIQKDMEVYVKEHANVYMPQVTVKTSKATDGTMVPVVEFNDNGKMRSMQLFGEKEKFAKIDKVVLTQLDFERVYDVFLRIQASDEKLQIEADAYKAARNGVAMSKMAPQSQSAQAQDFARFQGFLRVTPQMWKSMTTEARAQYIISMRLMWEDANRVLNPPAKKKSAKSNFDRLKLIVGEDAWARAPKRNTAAPVEKPSTNTNTGEGQSAIPKTAIGTGCMVAGYVSKYADVPVYKLNAESGEYVATSQTRVACSVENAIREIPASDPFGNKKANDICKGSNINSRRVACSTTLYG